MELWEDDLTSQGTRESIDIWCRVWGNTQSCGLRPASTTWNIRTRPTTLFDFVGHSKRLKIYVGTFLIHHRVVQCTKKSGCFFNRMLDAIFIFDDTQIFHRKQLEKSCHDSKLNFHQLLNKNRWIIQVPNTSATRLLINYLFFQSYRTLTSFSDCDKKGIRTT